MLKKHARNSERLVLSDSLAVLYPPLATNRYLFCNESSSIAGNCASQQTKGACALLTG
ncbi:hypothetical protein ACEF06_18235 [Brevibacillus agri]|uniref:hypothetical protein n=1 Tax=Brevibacillus TaxID=55080 RepID=UPI000414E9F7|nr:MULTISPECIES: hypothetical protein [Brevibacillus]MDR9506034.1 hypothetical protein [Brevibacillus agri]QHZ56503.1 hypothetical protein M655_013050 [Brevibacillus sp. NSP2.1]